MSTALPLRAIKKASPALRAGGSENNKQQDNIFELTVVSC